MLSLREIHRQLKDGDITCRQLLEQAIAARSSAFGAFRAVDDQASREYADALDKQFSYASNFFDLRGIPVSVKDLFGVPGFKTYAGSSTALPPRYETAGTIVERIRGQQATIVGKTHTVEFAYGGLGDHPNAPKNPWLTDAHYVAGGSSSGAGVSIIEGSSLVALGSDTAGSVRIPAAWTGTVGLKPTTGRWPTDGIVPLARTLDTPGLLTRTVDDLAFAFAAVDGCPPIDELPSLESIRIGIAQDVFLEDTQTDILELFATTTKRLEQQGAVVSDVHIPGLTIATELRERGGITGIELSYELTRHLPAWLAGLEPRIRKQLEAEAEISAQEYLYRLDIRAEAVRQAATLFGDFDIFVTPTVPISPPKIDTLVDRTQYERQNALALRNTAIVSTLGLCAMSIPIGLDANRAPAGIQLVAKADNELNLIAIAWAIENAIGKRTDLCGDLPRYRASSNTKT